MHRFEGHESLKLLANVGFINCGLLKPHVFLLRVKKLVIF